MKPTLTMGMFSNLMSKFFGQTSTISTAPVATGTGTSGPSMSVGASTSAGPATASGSVPAGPATASVPSSAGTPPVVDVTAILDGLAAKSPETQDWKKSIVDLLKLVGMDSSLAARKELAAELNYPGDQSDSAKMNVWLHKEVIKKLAANGGKVPADLLD